MSPAERRAVIVMAKRPSPGTTKTRLTPALSPEQAADVYEALLLDTLRFLQARSDCTIIIAIDKPESAAYFESIAPDVAQVLQVGRELGDRLDTVMSAALDQGFESVFAINSDSPDLPAAHLDHAFAALDQSPVDIVLGPTEDGGYYLIGWKQRASRVVTDVEMSTPRVLDDTLGIAAELNLTVHLAPQWHDVDTPADLARLQASLAGHSDSFTAELLNAYELAPIDTLAVVVPALDEEGNIAAVVAGLLDQAVDLVVVVDNGSTDRTAQVASDAGAIVVKEPVRGYGQACATGTAEALRRGASTLAYIDGDQSSLPHEIGRIAGPIAAGQADLVLGSRVLGTIDAGAMGAHQRFGNWLTSAIMRRLYRIDVTDLGPYRAIRADLLSELNMTEMTFGWPTEMMVKSARRKARIIEVPVTWSARNSGDSKVSGTVKGTVLSGWYLLSVTFKHAFGPNPPRWKQ